MRRPRACQSASLRRSTVRERDARGLVVCSSLLTVLLSLLVVVPAHAQPRDLHGRWYAVSADFRGDVSAFTPQAELTPLREPRRTGGRFVYRADFAVAEARSYVLDFRHSSTLGRYRHWLYDARGEQVAAYEGGIESTEENPFFLRHGREVTLEPGRYRLVTLLESPFLLGAPEPYLHTRAEYQRAIKAGNALTLVCLGVFVGLGFYYAVLALARRRVADAMYAVFIFGNLLYDGSALLVFSDLFGARWFYLVSVPILFSNAAYVLFVVELLEIRRATHRLLHGVAVALLACFAASLLIASLMPSWSLELDRYGVALMVSYGLFAAIRRTWEGASSARFYLLAVSVFFLLGGASISLSRVDGYTIYVEHLGLLAVAVEVALLALVLAHQFSLLHSAKDSAEHQAKESIRIAYRDALTGLPNRYSLESALAALPERGSLTFIDLDGLKHYNDKYGHKRGDELLCGFADHLARQLGDRAALFRLSGDEFAITCASGDVEFIARSVEAAITELRADSFPFAGASHGSVHVHESPLRDSLKHIADTRMYEHKRLRRASAPAAWLREALRGDSEPAPARARTPSSFPAAPTSSYPAASTSSFPASSTPTSEPGLSESSGTWETREESP